MDTFFKRKNFLVVMRKNKKRKKKEAQSKKSIQRTYPRIQPVKKVAVEWG